MDRLTVNGEFTRIIEGLDACDEVVTEWRLGRTGIVEQAVHHLPTGTHVIDAHVSPAERTITVLTEMGDTVELAWTTVGRAIEMFIMVVNGEAEVMNCAATDGGRLRLSLTDGQRVCTHEFDPISLNSLGFFD